MNASAISRSGSLRYHSRNQCSASVTSRAMQL